MARKKFDKDKISKVDAMERVEETHIQRRAREKEEERHKTWISIRKFRRRSAWVFGIISLILVFAIFPLADMGDIPYTADFLQIAIIYSTSLRSFIQPALIALGTIVVTTILGRIYDRFIKQEND